MNNKSILDTGNSGFYRTNIKLMKETCDKMENIRQEFHTEVNKLLSSYLNNRELISFKEKIGTSDKKQSTGDFINSFYAKQLKVEYEFTKDRMEIDRSITFAKKNLEKNKYLNFLRTLGQICIAHGKSNMAFEILNNAVKETEMLRIKHKAYFFSLMFRVEEQNGERVLIYWMKQKDCLIQPATRTERANVKTFSG